jgi:osmotically-inducible protein OsmY
LSGFVDSKQSKQVAEQVTRGVKGVVDVKNDLIVR